MNGQKAIIMRSNRLFLSPPHMSGNELRYIEQAFDSNYIAPAGPMIDGFEDDFKNYTGFKHAVAVSSGTAAIHLALRVLGIGEGDSVLASSFTFIGSVSPILYERATPVFIDSDAKSFCMDAGLLEESLRGMAAKNQLPKAVIPTDLYGQSCDIDGLRAACNRYDIPLIIDAAESVGAHYKNNHAGNGAHCAAFSFNGNKIITTSGGGMLASDDEKLIQQARYLSQQAREPAAHYEHTTYGYNYRMSNVLAAIGRAQLEVIESRVARRREIFARYKLALEDINGISFAEEMPYGRHSRWLSVMLIDANKCGASPEALRLKLETQNIESRPVWKPMHLQPVFKNAQMIGGTVCESIFAQGLCLPSGSSMTNADIDDVVDIIRKTLRK
jgi:dTDP-4-amino-4,6-dideoxygalactose transaminase